MTTTLEQPDILDGTTPARLADLSMCVAIDTETTGTNIGLGDRPFMVGMCDDEGRTWTCQWEVDPFTRKVLVDPSDRAALRFFFRHPERRFVFHHGKFDVRMLAAVGIDVPEGKWDDTLVAAKCLRTNERSYELKPMAKRYLDIPADDESDLLDAVRAARREARKKGWRIAEGKDAVKQDYWLAPEQCARYMLGDVVRTISLWLGIFKDTIDEDEVRATYDREIRLQPTVVRMEQRGCQVDVDELNTADARNEKRHTESLNRIRDMVGDPTFNPNSSPQKIRVLFGDDDDPTCNGLPGVVAQHFTKTGAPQTGKDALEEINHPIPKAILEWMKYEKLRQFYATWKRLMTAGGVLHPHLEPQAAKTGRFGCRGPNLQQVPKRTAEAKETRRCFVPRPGHVWWAFDYSQMELRLLAGLAGETSMLDAFANGRDIHAETGTRVFGHDVYWSNEDLYRTRSKNINFGIIYGMGPARLAAELDITFDEAVDFLNAYNEGFPKVREFMSSMVGLAERNGSFVNPFGRRINVSRLEPYKATNYIIQGSGADMIKRAMPRVEQLLWDYGVDARMILQVHDELIVEVKREDARLFLAHEIRSVMEDHGGHLDVDLPVDFAWVDDGESWADKTELPRDYLAAA